MDFQTRDHTVARIEWIGAGNEEDWFNPADVPRDQDSKFPPPAEDDGNTLYCYNVGIFVIRHQRF